MADPGTVAQTFFTDEEIGNYFLLDSILTVVDAKHAPQQLDEFREAQEQVGFADRILLSKTDLVAEEATRALVERLRHMNPRAPVKKVHFGAAPIGDILDIRGFNLNAILELDPEFLGDIPDRVAAAGVDLDSLRFLKRYEYEIEANWKISAENFLECYHCPVAHPGFSAVMDVSPDACHLEIDGVRMSQHSPPRPEPLRPPHRATSTLPRCHGSSFPGPALRRARCQVRRTPRQDP